MVGHLLCAPLVGRVGHLDAAPRGRLRHQGAEQGLLLGGGRGEGGQLGGELVYRQGGGVPGPLVAGQGGLPFKIKGAKLTSTSKDGQITFDSAKGRLEKSKVVIELMGDLSIEIGGTTTKVDLSQTQESSVETIDKLPWTAKK